MDVQFGFGADKRTTYDLPEVKCINMFAESATATPDRQVALLSCPGMASYATLAANGQGIARQRGVLDDDIFAVANTALYRVTDTPTPSSLGSVGTDTGFARFAFIRPAGAATKGYVAVIAGNGVTPYIYDNSTLATISDADVGTTVRDIASINGRILMATGNDTFIWSEVLDPTNYDALAFATAERSPDDLKAILVSNQEVWLMGADTIEPYVDTGGLDVFVPVQGGLIERGLLSRDLATTEDNTIFWVGEDRVVYRAEGYNPVRVSTHTQEEELQGLSDANAALSNMWSYSQDGHKFVIIRTPSKTMVFDVATGLWHDRETHNVATYRLMGAVERGGAIIGLDGAGADLYTLSPATELDNTSVIQRTVTANTPVRANTPAFAFALDCSKGTGSATGSDPQIMMRYSNDNGKTWSAEKWQSMGEQGEYGRQVIWRQLGTMKAPGRIWEVKVTDQATFTLLGARLNDLNS